VVHFKATNGPKKKQVVYTSRGGAGPHSNDQKKWCENLRTEGSRNPFNHDKVTKEEREKKKKYRGEPIHSRVGREESESSVTKEKKKKGKKGMPGATAPVKKTVISDYKKDKLPGGKNPGSSQITKWSGETESWV